MDYGSHDKHWSQLKTKFSKIIIYYKIHLKQIFSMSLVLEGATRIIHFAIFIHEKRRKGRLKKTLDYWNNVLKRNLMENNIYKNLFFQ